MRTLVVLALFGVVCGTGCSNLLGITDPSARSDGGVDPPRTDGASGPSDDAAFDGSDAPPPCVAPPRFSPADVYQPTGVSAGGLGLMAFGNFDTDGKLDLVIAAGTKVVILHGDGNAGFTLIQDVDTPADGVLATDFDNGFTDLLLWTAGSSTIVERQQDPTARGQFLVAKVLPNSFNHVRAVKLGLFDGNVTTDVLVQDDTELRFYTPNQIDTGNFSRGLVVGGSGDQLVQAPADLNGDRTIDDVALVTQTGNLMLSPKSGDKHVPAGMLAAGATADGVAFGNFDGDDKLDFIVATPDGGAVYHQTTGGSIPTYTRAAELVPGVTGPFVRVADVDGDGRDDLLVPAGILQQCDGGKFSTLVPIATAASTVVRDLDGNGKPELLRIVGQTLEVYRQ